MSEDKIKKLIEDIDIEATDHNAKMKLVQYGGVDEIGISTTKNGLIKFGLLILKAAYAKDKEEKNKIMSEISDLITNDSDYYFSWIETKDQIEEDESLPKSNIADYFALSLFFIFIAIIVVGFINGIRVVFNFIM